MRHARRALGGRPTRRAPRFVAIPVLLAPVLFGCTSDTTSEGDAPTTRESPAREAEAERIAAGGTVVDDRGPVGSAGGALLSPSIGSAVIEVDRSPGAHLDVDPRAVVQRELEEHGGKRDVVGAGDSAVPAREVYTAEDLRAITAESRAARSTAEQPAVYVLVLEGRYEDDQVTGVAFTATSFAVFPDQISGGLVGLASDEFETAVLVHELGHLFGLVDLTGHGAFHEDPEHPGHSASDESVMYWAVESVSIGNIFRGGPPRTFDEADREEMARIRAA